MFFIAGITGQVGGAAARQLLEDGHQVRTLVRDPSRAAEWSKRGVDVRQGDLNDASAVAAALEGVEGAFLLLPPVSAPEPGFPEAKRMIASYLDATRKAPPPRLVLLSSFGSEQTSRLGYINTTHLLERAFDNAPFPTAFLRAGAFIESYLYVLKMAEATGSFDILFTPTDRRVPMIATEDIGKETARLLASGWSGKKVLELGSPVSPDDLAEAMGEVLGRSVHARSVPREQWTATLETLGIPADRSAPFKEMMDAVNSGWMHFGVPGTEPVAAVVTPAEVFAKAR